MEHNIQDCKRWSQDGVITIRCPKCRSHGVNIDSRGDCKELIRRDDGDIIQCQCYAQEHK
jgi:Zn finger protein HypA/HybF involved in hydrogenase expression